MTQFHTFGLNAASQATPRGTPTKKMHRAKAAVLDAVIRAVDDSVFICSVPAARVGVVTANGMAAAVADAPWTDAAATIGTEGTVAEAGTDPKDMAAASATAGVTAMTR